VRMVILVATVVAASFRSKTFAKFFASSVDMIFADPSYNLSNGGITCHAGHMVS
jgi:DNA modification methylase